MNFPHLLPLKEGSEGNPPHLQFCCTKLQQYKCNGNRKIASRITHRMNHFMINSTWKIKRKSLPSPPSFIGRRWGKFIFLCTFHTNTTVKEPYQFRILSRRSWYLSFVFIISWKGAAQQNFCTLFFRIRILCARSHRSFPKHEAVYRQKYHRAPLTLI